MLAEDGKLSAVALAGRIGISAKAVEKHLAKHKACPPSCYYHQYLGNRWLHCFALLFMKSYCRKMGVPERK